jgi:hypothetical protein
MFVVLIKDRETSHTKVSNQKSMETNDYIERKPQPSEICVAHQSINTLPGPVSKATVVEENKEIGSNSLRYRIL